MKITAAYIEREHDNSDAVTAENLMYSAELTIREAIDKQCCCDKLLDKLDLIESFMKELNCKFEILASGENTATSSALNPATATRIVFGKLFKHGSNAPMPYATIYFAHTGVSTSSSGGIYGSSLTPVTTLQNGYFEVALAIPNGIYEEYIVHLPAGNQIHISVPVGQKPIHLATLIKAGVQYNPGLVPPINTLGEPISLGPAQQQQEQET